MRHQKNRHKLSRDSAHRKSLLMNLSKEIIEHERVRTSEAKAKAGRKFELLATNELPDEFTASPAISNGRIYLRGFKNLYAVQAGK